MRLLGPGREATPSAKASGYAPAASWVIRRAGRVAAGLGLLALFLFSPCRATAEPTRVVAAGGVPFLVERADAGLGGLSVDVWRLLAEAEGLDYAIERVGSVEDALEHVARGTADVAVGPISISGDRATRVDFTQPYFQAGIAILSRQSLSPTALFGPLLSRAFLTAVLVLLASLSVVGALLWLCERRANPDQFASKPLRGLADGVWCAWVTMTTVGFGDVTPVTRAGRVVAGAWMLVAVVSLSSLTATLAGAFTAARLEHAQVSSVDGLERRRVAAVSGSTGVGFARRHGARVVEVDDLERSVALLTDGGVDAVVYDRPMLEYHLSQHPELDLTISPRSHARQGYGFAFRKGSELGQRMNLALLRVGEAGGLQQVVSRWLRSGD